MWLWDGLSPGAHVDPASAGPDCPTANISSTTAVKLAQSSHWCHKDSIMGRWRLSCTCFRLFCERCYRASSVKVSLTMPASRNSYTLASHKHIKQDMLFVIIREILLRSSQLLSRGLKSSKTRLFLHCHDHNPIRRTRCIRSTNR